MLIQYSVRIDDGSSDDWADIYAYEVQDAARKVVEAASAHGMSWHGGPIHVTVRELDGVAWKVPVNIDMEPTFYPGPAKLIK